MKDAQSSFSPQQKAGPGAISNAHAGSQLRQSALSVPAVLEINPSRFNLVHVLQIVGALDVLRLEESLRKLKRQPLFAYSGDERDVNSKASVDTSVASEPLKLLDLGGLHPAAQKYSFNSVIQDLQAGKITPIVDEPFRASLIRWNNEKHSLVFLASLFIVDAPSMERLAKALVQAYAELDTSDAQAVSQSASQNGKNGLTDFGERATGRPLAAGLPGRAEIEEILQVESIGIFSGQTEGARDVLKQRAAEALLANLARNPLPKPVVTRPPLDKRNREQIFIGGKTWGGLEFTIQTVTPHFSQSAGTVHFFSDEIRNPIGDADISLYLSPREAQIRMLLNYDSDQLEENEIRRWFGGYRETFAQFLSINEAKPSDKDSKGLTDGGLANDIRNPESSWSGNPTDRALASSGIALDSSVDVHAPSSSAELNTAPSTPIEKALAHIWSELLAIDQIGVDENFFDLGGHSLLAVRLFSKISNEFGQELSLNALLEHTTIRELAQLLGAPAPQATDSECRLIPLEHRAPSSKPTFFWIPGGRGISVLAFREVSRLLGADRAVYGLESRLPGDGEHVLTVPERASKYVSLLRSVQPKGPYYLAGFCMGGMVAFEMAQQLKATGEEVAFLALIQASMPGFPALGFQRWRMMNQHRWYLAKTFLKFLFVRTSSGIFYISRDKKQRVFDEVSKAILGWQGTSAQLPDETQTTNSRVMYEYRPHAYSGDVHLILAEDCYESSGIRPELDSRRAWFTIIRGNCFIHIYPGDHNSIIAGGNASRLAHGIRSLIENTAKERASS